MAHSYARYILAIACLSLSLVASAASSVTDSLLRVYRQEVGQAEMYLARRQASIDSLCALEPSSARLLEIGELYRPYQCDSALAYLTAAADMAPAGSVDQKRARINLVFLLASIGFYSEGFETARIIGRVPDALRVDYYEAMNRLYYSSSEYGKQPAYRDECLRRATLYEDSLMAAIRAAGQPSVMYYKVLQIHARVHDNCPLALSYSDSALCLVAPFSHDYAIMAYERSMVFLAMGDNEQYRQWLIRSAIADVRCGITDNGSSWMLAQMVYDDGNVDDARTYIDYSITNAGRFNARLRYMQINPIALIVNRAYQTQQQRLSRGLMVATIALGVVLLLIMAMVVYTVRQNRRLHALNQQHVQMNQELQTLNTRLQTLNSDLSQLNLSLQEASLVKEQYICRYLEVYSEYVRRLTQMARKAGVKDPDAFNSKEMAEFYRSFDNTFLTIYRSFVTDFNALLRPEDRIVPKQGELLTTELRIFALIRLGIDSSSKIAELLCYSPNTIYNYRARVKNSALGNREEFEDRVRHLCTVSLPTV